jgi:D-aminopeptidase
VIAVLATDAPLSAPQLNRLCKRVALGIGRVGSYAAHGSGEIILGFSTANVIPRNKRSKRHTFTFLSDRCVDPLYQAAIECTEEAILNALCMAQGMSGVSDHYAPPLPVERLIPRLAALGL